VAEALPKPNDAKWIGFECEEEYKTIKEQVEDLKTDIGTQDNGAV
jgi:hypothetical protein